MTNVQILMEAVLTPVTTLLVHSLVPVQVVWSWILANEVAKVILNFRDHCCYFLYLQLSLVEGILCNATLLMILAPLNSVSFITLGRTSKLNSCSCHDTEGWWTFILLLYQNISRRLYLCSIACGVLWGEVNMERIQRFFIGSKDNGMAAMLAPHDKIKGANDKPFVKGTPTWWRWRHAHTLYHELQHCWRPVAPTIL